MWEKWGVSTALRRGGGVRGCRVFGRVGFRPIAKARATAYSRVDSPTTGAYHIQKEEIDMKIPTLMFTIIAALATAGCHPTQVSSQGGITPINEQFSITVPQSETIKQGSGDAITITLNRGDYFKRDVDLVVSATGISITPGEVLVKASDKPDVQFQITVSRDAAIGEYPVTVTGTPTSGSATSTVFKVEVVAQ